MTEEEVRLALLQTELNGIHAAIRGLDTILFQIKGWCVTAALAIGGFAVAYRHPALIVAGMAAVAGFYLMNCQFKMLQRSFIKRNQSLEAELKRTGLMQFVRGAGSIEVVGTAAPEWPRAGTSTRHRVVRHLPEFWHEARLPDSYSLYLFILVCLTVEAIILF
ncbi:MAG: hypothetical protein LBI49_19205 [Nocardiopsaceae bacterium]|jgi:hypothetical protein|nr:hypothetical protein [Nocardiopsaceae bacterium]